MAKKTLQRISVNEQLLNRYTRHAVYLQQLEKGEALRIGRFMKQNVFPSIFQKLIAELNKVKDIQTIGSARRIKRLNQMLATVRQTAIAGFVKAEKQAISRLIDVSKFEAKWNINTIERTVPLDISMVMPSNAVLRTLVTTRAFGGPDNQHKLNTWFKGLSKSVRNNVNKQLRVGIATGESVPALGKRVQKAFNTGTKQAQAIARTVTSAVVHNAREEVFKANKKIVPKVQWTATLDDRTTVVCANLDGKIFETGTGPRPPIHFQCRSTVVPVTPSWQEFGVTDPPPATRASMNGAVPAKLTYKKWFKTQSKATQVRVLGKKKAELYRSGRVKIEKFSSRDLKPLTLKQIARREGIDVAPIPPSGSGFRSPESLRDLTKKFDIDQFKKPVKVTGTRTSSGVTVTGNVSKSFERSVIQHIDTYPEKVKLALNNNGVSFHIGNRMTSMYPRLKNKLPRGRAPGNTYATVNGLFDGKTRAISVSERYRRPGTKTFETTSSKRIREILNHETGHGYDATGIGLQSNHRDFKAVYLRDVKSLTDKTIKTERLNYFLPKGDVAGKGLFGDPTEAGRVETFAQIFADAAGVGGSGHDIRKFFPGSTKYVEGLLK